MVWTIEFADTAVKQLKKMDRSVARSIIEYLDQRMAPCENPRDIGKKLVGPKYGHYWRFRLGDIRIICEIQDQKLTILVLELGNRREIYR